MFNTNETQLYKQKYTQGNCDRLRTYMYSPIFENKWIQPSHDRNYRRRFALRPRIQGRLSQELLLFR